MSDVFCPVGAAVTPARKAELAAMSGELNAPRLEERIPCCDVCGAHHGMRGVRFIVHELRRVSFACERCVRRMTSELWGAGLAGGAIAAPYSRRNEPIDYNPLVDANTKTVKP